MSNKNQEELNKLEQLFNELIKLEEQTNTIIKLINNSSYLDINDINIEIQTYAPDELIELEEQPNTTIKVINISPYLDINDNNDINVEKQTYSPEAKFYINAINMLKSSSELRNNILPVFKRNDNK
jgi:SepF-like predicted cell division protein (DUF552 family)